MAQNPQKHLGSKGLIVLIALLSAFVPLSTDLYLPALPKMGDYFHASVAEVNWTLTAFFICYALGTLVWGPLSDRYGRKPILVAGLTAYAIASVSCALMPSLTGLILSRMLQAAGGSAAGAVATAIVKDVYSGRRRESVLAVVQSMVLISPALAPVLGAFLLKVISWRGVFWTLAIIGLLALIGSLMFQETIVERHTGQLHQSLLRIGSVIRNRNFTFLLVIFSIGSISGMAFIAGSTFIYQDGFHLSSQAYSFYFSLNALGMIAGPMIYLWLSRRRPSMTIITAGFIIILASGLLVCLLGNLNPWVFALCILPASVARPLLSPPSANLMLEQQKGDTGTVSSLMSCTGLLMGSLGMELIALPWGNMILALGIMTITTASLSLLAWPFARRQITRLPAPATVAQDAASGES